MKLSRAACMICLGAMLGSGPPLLSQTLSGRVCDYVQSTESKPVGIPGVQVSLLWDEKSLAEQVTSADGFFSFDKVPVGVAVTLEFRRIGYIRRPTIKSARTEKHPSRLADVFLLKETDANAAGSLATRFNERLKRQQATYESELEVLSGFGLAESQLTSVLAQIEAQKNRPERPRIAGIKGSKIKDPTITHRPRVAVLKFKNEAGSAWWWSDGAEEAHQTIVEELVESGKFRVVERKKLDGVTPDESLTLTGDDLDPASAVRLGKLLRADYLLTGTVTEFGVPDLDPAVKPSRRNFVATLKARLIDTSTGETVWANEARVEEERFGSSSRPSAGRSSGARGDRMSDDIIRQCVHKLIASLKLADL